MTLNEAIYVAEEMNKWRKREPPYNTRDEYGLPSLPPFLPTMFGEAIDILIAHAKNTQVHETDNYNYD